MLIVDMYDFLLAFKRDHKQFLDHEIKSHCDNYGLIFLRDETDFVDQFFNDDLFDKITDGQKTMLARGFLESFKMEGGEHSGYIMDLDRCKELAQDVSDVLVYMDDRGKPKG